MNGPEGPILRAVPCLSPLVFDAPAPGEEAENCRQSLKFSAVGGLFPVELRQEISTAFACLRVRYSFSRAAISGSFLHLVSVKV